MIDLSKVTDILLGGKKVTEIKDKNGVLLWSGQIILPPFKEPTVRTTELKKITEENKYENQTIDETKYNSLQVWDIQTHSFKPAVKNADGTYTGFIYGNTIETPNTKQEFFVPTSYNMSTKKLEYDDCLLPPLPLKSFDVYCERDIKNTVFSIFTGTNQLDGQTLDVDGRTYFSDNSTYYERYKTINILRLESSDKSNKNAVVGLSVNENIFRFNTIIIEGDVSQVVRLAELIK